MRLQSVSQPVYLFSQNTIPLFPKNPSGKECKAKRVARSQFPVALGLSLNAGQNDIKEKKYILWVLIFVTS